MSSLVFLGLSTVGFLIIYGIMILVLPIITGQFFSSVDTSLFVVDPTWLELYNQNEDTVKYLVPVIPTFGIFIVILKVVMTAAARGQD